MLFRFGGCTSRLIDYFIGNFNSCRTNSHLLTRKQLHPHNSRNPLQARHPLHHLTKCQRHAQGAPRAQPPHRKLWIQIRPRPTHRRPTPQLQLLRCQRPNPCHPGATACSPPPRIPLIQVCGSRRDLRHAQVPILVRRPSPRIEQRATRRVLLEGKTQRHSFFFFFVLIILYSLYLEYDSPLVPSGSGLAG